MLRWLLRRLGSAALALLGITFVTFCALDLAPVDRAALELAQRSEQPGAPELSVVSRDIALAKLRLRYGLVDEKTLQPAPVTQRYLRWLQNAATLRFCGPGEDPKEFRSRIGRALPVTLLLGSLSLCVALLLGVPLGAWLGMRAGSLADRAVGGALLVLAGLPDALVATIGLVLFAGPVFDWLPAGGFGASDDAASRGALAAWLDASLRLVLPLSAMAIGPLVLIARFLRESVARTAASPFADNLIAWGFPEKQRARRILRVALSPLATLAGSLLPMLVAGSIVVESVFAIDGMGRLAFEAVRANDHAMTMAVTLIGAVATLMGFVLSDLLHRALDPRVRLDA